MENINRRTAFLFVLTPILFGPMGGGLLPAFAQESVSINFEPGATSTTINGTIIGNEYIDYVVGARSGQTMVVSLSVTGTNGNGLASFNILPAGKDFPAVFNGSNEGNQAEVSLPSSGKWAVRVYLMGNDRDAGKTVGFSINVHIAPETGDSSLDGSPSRVVAGVPANDVLNVRGGPGAGNRIVGALGNGDRVNMIGCQEVDGSSWCEIEMQTDMRERGWVNSRYLK